MRVTTLKLLAVFVFAGLMVLFWNYRVPALVGHTKRPDRPPPVPSEVTGLAQRMQVKGQLARRIVAERVSLREAAELFNEVNGEDGTALLVRAVRGRSVREKLCRQVIMYVAGAEDDMQQEGHILSDPRVSAELQTELDRLLAVGELPPEPGMW